MSERLKAADIFEWLNSCVSECEADGYQQREASDDPWCKDGEPTIIAYDGKCMIVETVQGDRFRITATRIAKPKESQS